MLSPAIRALAQQRQDDLLDDAVRYRLRRHRQGNARERLRLAAGRVLVAVGVWLAGRRPDEVAGLRTYPLRSAVAPRRSQ